MSKIETANIGYLTMEQITQLFEEQINGIISYIKKIYFDEKRPENHLFCSPVLDNKYISVYNHELNKSESQNKKEVWDGLLTRNINDFVRLYDEHRHKFTTNTQKKYSFSTVL